MKKSVVLILELGTILSLYAQEEMTREEWGVQQQIRRSEDSISRIEWNERCRQEDARDKALRSRGITPRKRDFNYWMARRQDSFRIFNYREVAIIKEDLLKRKRLNPAAHERQDSIENANGGLYKIFFKW